LVVAAAVLAVIQVMVETAGAITLVLIHFQGLAGVAVAVKLFYRPGKAGAVLD